MQGDFTQWVALFNRFDEFFDEHVKSRKDLQLAYAAPGATQPAADPPFPVDNCMEVLRVTSILLDNCSSKHLYASYEVGGLCRLMVHTRVPSTRWKRACATRCRQRLSQTTSSIDRSLR